MSCGCSTSGSSTLAAVHGDGAPRRQDLGALLAHSGPMSVPDAVECILQACEALARPTAWVSPTGHQAENCSSPARGWHSAPQGLDFGIATPCSAVLSTAVLNANVTHQSQTVGTPAYMSPEQLRSGRDVDARSDIFAIRSDLYELLSAVCIQRQVVPRAVFRDHVAAAAVAAHAQSERSFSSTRSYAGVSQERENATRRG